MDKLPRQLVTNTATQSFHTLSCTCEVCIEHSSATHETNTSTSSLHKTYTVNGIHFSNWITLIREQKNNMSTMSSSVCYDTEGSATGAPANRRTMAMQFADAMLQPPVYLSIQSNFPAECLPHSEREQHLPSFYPRDVAPRAEAPDSMLRVSQWLEDMECVGAIPPRRPAGTAKKVSTGKKAIRDSLLSCLQSMRPAMEMIRAQRAALLERLNNGPPAPATSSGKTEWEVDWKHPANMHAEELAYLASVVNSEWFTDRQTY